MTVSRFSSQAATRARSRVLVHHPQCGTNDPIGLYLHTPCRIWRKPTISGQGGRSGIGRSKEPRVLTVASSRSAAGAGRLPLAGGEAGAFDTGRVWRRCQPRDASSPRREGVTDSRSRRSADHPSESAHVTDAERLTWPGAARRFQWSSASPGVHWRFPLRDGAGRLLVVRVPPGGLKLAINAASAYDALGRPASAVSSAAVT
jgi:hypothetical protein